MNKSSTHLPKHNLNREEILRYLSNRGLIYEFNQMEERWRENFIDFCSGRTTLPLLYDTTFKRIFDPIIHRDRLSDLISCILNQKVTVKEVFPSEDSFIEGGKAVIMDIIVELCDGSIADVEIQKSPYNFAGERISCFSSDLMLRQYSKVKGKLGTVFKYKDLRMVYTIIIYEKTVQAFHEFDDIYMHRGKVTYDSGLQLNMLQDICLIALDHFRKIAYHKDDSRLVGWLSFLVTEDIKDAVELANQFEWLKPIYEEIASYRNNPEEVFNMYSSMIAELDRNSLQYLVDEQQEQIDTLDKQLQTERLEHEKDRELIAKLQAELANR